MESNKISISRTSKDKLDYINPQDIMDPISRKIVSIEQFEKGITQSIELARKNLYNPGIKITDPISHKTTDIFTLMENNEKRYKFIHNINKNTASISTLEASDALSIMEGGLEAAKEFVDDHGIKSKIGFWIQTTGS